MIGFFLGPASDLFHNVTNTSGYPYPAFLGLAWWVPLLFSGATVLVALSHVYSDKLFRQPKRELSWKKVIFGLLSFFLIYAISGFLKINLLPKFLILAVIALDVWFFFDKTLYGFILSILTAICGCLVESSLVQIGHFYYVEPDFLGVPYWLPFLYITASVSVGNLGRKLFEDVDL